MKGLLTEGFKPQGKMLFSDLDAPNEGMPMFSLIKFLSHGLQTKARAEEKALMERLQKDHIVDALMRVRERGSPTEMDKLRRYVGRQRIIDGEGLMASIDDLLQADIHFQSSVSEVDRLLDEYQKIGQKSDLSNCTLYHYLGERLRILKLAVSSSLPQAMYLLLECYRYSYYPSPLRAPVDIGRFTRFLSNEEVQYAKNKAFELRADAELLAKKVFETERDEEKIGMLKSKLKNGFPEFDDEIVEQEQHTSWHKEGMFRSQ